MSHMLLVKWAVLLTSPALFDDMVWEKAGISRMRGSGCNTRVWNIHQVLHQSQQAVTNLSSRLHDNRRRKQEGAQIYTQSDLFCYYIK